MKQTIYHNTNHTTHIPCQVDESTYKHQLKDIHIIHVTNYIATLAHNKILGTLAPTINTQEEELPRHMRRTLAQLRAGKSPLLKSYLHKVDSDNTPTDSCPLCNTHPHNTSHLFDCTHIPTQLTTLSLWQSPLEAAALVTRWKARLDGEGSGVDDPGIINPCPGGQCRSLQESEL